MSSSFAIQFLCPELAVLNNSASINGVLTAPGPTCNSACKSKTTRIAQRMRSSAQAICKAFVNSSIHAFAVARPAARPSEVSTQPWAQCCLQALPGHLQELKTVFRLGGIFGDSLIAGPPGFASVAAARWQHAPVGLTSRPAQSQMTESPRNFPAGSSSRTAQLHGWSRGADGDARRSAAAGTVGARRALPPPQQDTAELSFWHTCTRSEPSPPPPPSARAPEAAPVLGVLVRAAERPHRRPVRLVHDPRREVLREACMRRARHAASSARSGCRKAPGEAPPGGRCRRRPSNAAALRRCPTALAPVEAALAGAPAEDGGDVVEEQVALRRVVFIVVEVVLRRGGGGGHPQETDASGRPAGNNQGG